MSPTDTIPTKISPPAYPVSSGTPILTSPPISSYPAVLVGRSSIESKPKVPPPVPPRGTPKLKKGNVNGKGAMHCFVGTKRSHAYNTLLIVDSDVHDDRVIKRSRSADEYRTEGNLNWNFADVGFYGSEDYV